MAEVSIISVAISMVTQGKSLYLWAESLRNFLSEMRSKSFGLETIAV